MATSVNLAHLRPLDHKTSMQLAARENELFAALLRDLDETEWDLQTDCELWSVRDIVAHLIGWAECVSSPKEAAHQVGSMVRRRSEFDNIVHAQNQVQVEDRRPLSPAQLVETYEETSARMLRVRNVVGVVGKAIPMYNSLVGGLASVGFVADTIFTRDTFMHRIDISRAAGRELTMGLFQETLVADIVRDWAGRIDVPVRVELEGSGGGLFAHEGARVTVRASAPDFCRFMAGRLAEDELDIQGQPAEIEKALAKKAPF